jgi:hypothetical protein
MTPQNPDPTAREPTSRPNMCRQCGETISRRAKAGRPPVYCSTACRRAAGFEVRRLNDHVERLERELSEWIMLAPDTATVYGCTVAERREVLSAEITRQQARLRDLLAESTTG